MSSFALSMITFVVVFGGALVGNALRGVLPEDELSAESKDAVKLGVGLIATMAALVLGLLTASAKSWAGNKSCARRVACCRRRRRGLVVVQKRPGSNIVGITLNRRSSLREDRGAFAQRRQATGHLRTSHVDFDEPR